MPVGEAGSTWTVSVGRPRSRKRLQHLTAQVIVADPRDEARVGPQRAALEGEVGGRPAELLAGRQQVPEHLAQREDLESHVRPQYPFRH